MYYNPSIVVSSMLPQASIYHISIKKSLQATPTPNTKLKLKPLWSSQTPSQDITKKKKKTPLNDEEQC